MDPIVPPSWMPAGVPYWSGAAVFGDPSQFGSALFTGPAAGVDSFLGLAPGTTVYDPGRAVGITGVLTGPTSAAVAAAQQTLAGLATPPALGTARLIANTGVAGLPFRGWDAWGNCWFAPTDLAFDAGGITQTTTGYQLPYRLVVRGATLVDSCCAPTRPDYPAQIQPWDGNNPYTP